MNILGIDTTAKNASVVVKNDNGIYSKNDINNITHSEKLLPLIHSTLQESSTTFNNIDLLATTNGPGSFTGCRIGVATIKALSHSNNIDILAISSLELIAFQAYFNLNESTEKYICSMLDARNNRVYYAVYKIYLEEGKINIQNVYDISNDDIYIVLENLSTFNSCIFTGDCINNFKDSILEYSINNKLNYTCIENEILPEAKYLISYYSSVSEKILSNKFYNTYNLDVVYSRASQAERMKNEEH